MRNRRANQALVGSWEEPLGDVRSTAISDRGHEQLDGVYPNGDVSRFPERRSAPNQGLKT